jgi:hypothetical protein
MNMGSMNFSFSLLTQRYNTWKFDWERSYVANSDCIFFATPSRTSKALRSNSRHRRWKLPVS